MPAGKYCGKLTTLILGAPFIAFGTHDDKAKQPWFVIVKSLEGETEKSFTLPAFCFRRRWIPDSESLVSIEQSFEGAKLWQTNIKTGERQQITKFNAERIYNFDVSIDGRFLSFRAVMAVTAQF